MIDRDAASALLPELRALLERHNRQGVPLNEATDLVGDLAFDSLTVMEVVAEVEDRFDVSIPLNGLPEVRTVGDFARMVAALRRDAVHG
jgi:acyl carrier protein